MSTEWTTVAILAHQSEVQDQRRVHRSRATRHEHIAPFALFGHQVEVAVIRPARDHTRCAGSAYALLAGGWHLDTRLPQSVYDRFALAHTDSPPGACDHYFESDVLGGRAVPGEALRMHAVRWPSELMCRSDDMIDEPRRSAHVEMLASTGLRNGLPRAKRWRGNAVVAAQVDVVAIRTRAQSLEKGDPLDVAYRVEER